MKLEVMTGNVLDVPADVLISTANPWLQMSGGVNLAIILRPKGEVVHEELQSYLQSMGKKAVKAGTVVCTGPASLPVAKILHAVSIDPFYDSSRELVSETIIRALTRAIDLEAKSVTLPALATGFGPLSMEDFSHALLRALERDWSPLEVLKVVLKHEEDAGIVRSIVASATIPGTNQNPSAETRSRPVHGKCENRTRANYGCGVNGKILMNWRFIISTFALLLCLSIRGGSI